MVLVPIIDNYSTFSRTERAIADYILSDPEEALSKTVHGIARITGTSPASVIRFSKKMNFETFADMKVGLAKYFNANSHPIKNLTVNHGDTPESCAKKLLEQIQNVCYTTAESIKYPELIRTVNAISDADNVYLFGVGSSGTVAADLQQKLIRVGKRVYFSADSHTGLLHTANCTKNDVAIAFSFSGSTRITLDSLRSAFKAGALCIAITGNATSSITKYAHIILNTPSLEQKLRIGAVSSRYSQQFICDMIFLNLIVRYYDKAEELSLLINDLVSDRHID